MFKMVALDLDGTLLTDDKKITPENMQALHRLMEKGIVVTLSTGRNIINTEHVAEKIGIQSPYSCLDGCIIYDGKKILSDCPIDKKEYQQVIDNLFDDYGYVEVATSRNYYKYVKSDDYRKYDFDYTIPGKNKMLGIVRPEDRSVLNGINDEIYGIIFAGEEQAVAQGAKGIAGGSFSSVEVWNHLWQEFCFLYGKGAGKMNGVIKICNYLGIAPDEVVAMGDQLNDLDMIEFSGMGVAMGNAHTRVKEKAKMVTGANNENGVAQALKKLFG